LWAGRWDELLAFATEPTPGSGGRPVIWMGSWGEVGLKASCLPVAFGSSSLRRVVPLRQPPEKHKFENHPNAHAGQSWLGLRAHAERGGGHVFHSGPLLRRFRRRSPSELRAEGPRLDPCS